MSETVKYFGYGANRDAQMIAFITGKPVGELVGHEAVLEGFGLGVQRLDQVPDSTYPGSMLPESPRTILRREWGDAFRTYVIFSKPGGQVQGTVWELSPDERERVRDWEIVGPWYKEDFGMAVTTEGEQINVNTESLGDGQTFDHEVDGLHYETWLQPAHMFEVIATKARREYDKRQAGPEGPRANP